MNISRLARVMFHYIVLGLVVLGFGFGAVALRAQTPTGSVTGVIRDPTGAVLGGAAVTATNVDTAVSYNATSAPDGNYVLPVLPIGHYSIKVLARGFRSDERTGLIIAVDQHAQIDFSLQTGSTTETVTVSADATQTEAETHSIGTVVD